MIKQIFTWWNNQTFGTFLYTVFFGRFVGKDITGNKYYENKKGKRWVIYKGEINASKITSDWFSWIHHTSNKYQTKKNKKNIHGKNLI
jgi:NADH:ubiquinone oxidoreductase 17.2 kD subunit